MDAAKIQLILGITITILAALIAYLHFKIVKLTKRVNVLQSGLLDTLDAVINIKEVLVQYFKFLENFSGNATSITTKETKNSDLSDEPEDAAPWI